MKAMARPQSGSVKRGKAFGDNQVTPRGNYVDRQVGKLEPMKAQEMAKPTDKVPVTLQMQLAGEP